MEIGAVVSLIREAKRPLFIFGAGMRPYAKEALSLARSLGIPIACTWGAVDIVHHDDPLMAGGFGTHGTRAANFAVSNADLLISIASRLDTKATASPSQFGRAAHIVMCDIDRAEIEKFKRLGRTIDIGIEADAGEFIEALHDRWDHYHAPLNYIGWIRRIGEWKTRYALPKVNWPGVNPYQLMHEIARYTTKEDILVSDTGTALGYVMQAFPFKGERFLHDFNQTAMGWGLPAAIGAHFATGKRIILVVGDGSIMMSLPELATVSRWNLPIKIILLNNQGHAMCRQTQRQWLGGKYPATSVEGGLGFPRFHHTGGYFGIRTHLNLGSLFNPKDDSPHFKAGFLEIPIHPDASLIPQAKYGQPIEDADPLLPWDELCEQMIIPPLERK